MLVQAVRPIHASAGTNATCQLSAAPLSVERGACQLSAAPLSVERGGAPPSSARRAVRAVAPESACVHAQQQCVWAGPVPGEGHPALPATAAGVRCGGGGDGATGAFVS
jgi:hypothetical protein